MRWRWIPVLLIGTVAPAAAQARAELASSEVADTVGPIVSSATKRWSQPVGDVWLPVRQQAPAAAATTPVMLAPSGQSRALMVAGAALFAAGIIAGGDAGAILMLGGAGIGAYGLYLHFR